MNATVEIVEVTGSRVMEPVIAAARYADGSKFLLTQRTAPAVPNLVLPTAYRTFRGDDRWQMVWSLPDALWEFITTQPVGSAGKVSNRQVRVVDVADVAPDGVIEIWASGDTWVGY